MLWHRVTEAEDISGGGGGGGGGVISGSGGGGGGGGRRRPPFAFRLSLERYSEDTVGIQ